MNLPKKNKLKMSETYFNSIQNKLYVMAYFYYYKYQQFFDYHHFVSKQDVAQVGVIGVLDMRDGLKETMYMNRIKRRILDYYRYLDRRRKWDNGFKLLENIRINGGDYLEYSAKKRFKYYSEDL